MEAESEEHGDEELVGGIVLAVQRGVGGEGADGAPGAQEAVEENGVAGGGEVGPGVDVGGRRHVIQLHRQ